MRGEPYQFFLNTPWGENLENQFSKNYTSFSSRFRFNGKEWDEETGNFYYGARYYDPKISVWLSVDPLAHEFPALSPYNMLMNNPLIMVDPGGDSTFFYDSDGNYLYTSNDGLTNGITIIDPEGMEGFNMIKDGIEAGDYENSDEMWQQARDHGTTYDLATSDLGIMARVVYAEMRGGDMNAKTIVAESIRNRCNLDYGAYERYNGSVKGIVDGAYDVSNPLNASNPVYRLPLDYAQLNILEAKSFRNSISASIKALYLNSNVGDGVIFYHSTSSDHWDSNTRLQKLNLGVTHSGIKGVWKLK